MNLQDKVIAVTGGAQGLGLSMATALAAKGAKLALVDLNQEKLGAKVGNDLVEQSDDIIFFGNIG